MGILERILFVGREQSVRAIAEGIISRKETPPSDSN